MSSISYSYAGAGTARPTSAKCAYVVLVWGSDRYVPGALVLAGSLRQVGAKHDLVCMATPGVSAASRERLGRVYDHVVLVEEIARESRKFAAEQQGKLYNGWIDTSYTKWNALRLTGYARVLVVDSDMLFLVNCDELFELAPPAACFSMPWATPHQSGIGNPYLRGGRPPAHGDTVAAETIRGALSSDRFSFVGCTWTTLLEPDMDVFDDLMEVIGRERPYAEGCPCVNGPDEISLAEVYAERDVDFRHIAPRFAAIPWHPQWAGADARALHYHGGSKPWECERGRWPDLLTWWSAADALSSKYPGILDPPRSPRGSTDGPALAAAPLSASGPPCPRPAGEAAQLELTLELREILAGYTRAARPGREKAAQAEANNFLERWAIALANAGGPRPYPFWPIALTRGGEAANGQLLRELADFSPQLAPRAKSTLSDALAAIRRGAGAAGPSKPRGALEAPGGGPADKIPAGRLRLLTGLGGPDATSRMALRYEALAPGGCQWRFPSEHAAHLFASHGVRNEGFASPLNSNFIGREGGAYYSLFPDTDRPFGSSGDFFGADMSRGGGWLINPPFIETILEGAALKVQAALRGELSAPLSVFFVVPTWTDSAAYRVLSGSEHLLASIDLMPGQYYYESPSGEKVRTRARSTYFALSSDLSEPNRKQAAAAIGHLAGAPEESGAARPKGPPGGPEGPAARSSESAPRAPPEGRWPSLVPGRGRGRGRGRRGRGLQSDARPQATLWPKRDGYAGH